MKYLVSEFGGEYDSSWTHPVGICSTLELANSLKNRIENFHNMKCSIDVDTWADMCDEYYEKCDNEDEDIIDGLHRMFPSIPVSELKLAENCYDNYDDYCGVSIEEVDEYDTESKIEKWNSN